MRISPVLPAIVAASIAAVYGCSLPLEGLPDGAGGDGGSTSATSAGGAPLTTTSSSDSTGSSTATGPLACDSDSDCGTKTPCTSFACTLGKCVGSTTPDGTGLPDNHAGDCQRPVCMGGAMVMEPSPDDTAEDDNQCTVASCKNGMLVQSPAKNGTACGTDQHCFNGECHECAASADCKDDGNVCTNAYCNKGTCEQKGTINTCDNGGFSYCIAGSCCPQSKLCGFGCCSASEHCTWFGCAPN